MQLERNPDYLSQVEIDTAVSVCEHMAHLNAAMKRQGLPRHTFSEYAEAHALAGNLKLADDSANTGVIYKRG